MCRKSSQLPARTDLYMYYVSKTSVKLRLSPLYRDPTGSRPFFTHRTSFVGLIEPNPARPAGFRGAVRHVEFHRRTDEPVGEPAPSLKGKASRERAYLP